MKRSRWRWVLPTWLGLGLLYLFIPVILVILFSFNDVQGRFWVNARGLVMAWFDDGSIPFETRFARIEDLLAEIGWSK